jgi:hypothetical protein
MAYGQHDQVAASTDWARNRLCPETAARAVRAKPEITVVEDRAMARAEYYTNEPSEIAQVIGYYNLSLHRSRARNCKGIIRVNHFGLAEETQLRRPRPGAFQ